MSPCDSRSPALNGQICAAHYSLNNYENHSDSAHTLVEPHLNRSSQPLPSAQVNRTRLSIAKLKRCNATKWQGVLLWLRPRHTALYFALAARQAPFAASASSRGIVTAVTGGSELDQSIHVSRARPGIYANFWSPAAKFETACMRPRWSIELLVGTVRR